MKKLEPRILLRNLAAEIIIYSLLLVGYYFLVIHWMQDWIPDLFAAT